MSTEPGSTAAPRGREEVMRALVDATIELIVDKGTAMSVREISALAGVNHGLVHAYFGGKPGLVQAAFDDIQQRFAAERHVHGFPPPDLAARRDALLAKALARATLEGREGPFSAHRITTGWREAIEATRSDLDDGEIAERVAAASAIGLGYALFADMLSDALDLDSGQRAAVDERIASLVAEIGVIPDRAPGTSPPNDD